MLNRKLMEVLGHQTAAEKKRLRLFLTSPYFNNGSNSAEVVRLYDLIIRYNAEENHPALSKESVFRLFFPGNPYHEKVKSPLDSLTSELFRLVRFFLVQTEMERENGEIAEHLAMAKFYRKFAFEERYWQTIRTLRKLQEESPWRDARYYFDQLRIEEEELSFRGLYNSFEDDANLNAVHNNLDLYYSIQKLAFACALEHQRQAAQIDNYPPTPLLESILALSEEEGPLDVPINRLYKLVLQLIENPESEKLFNSFERLLEKYKALIPDERFKDFQAYYRFFWVQRYQKSGDNFSLHRTFDIYREHLEKGYYYFDGLIPLSNFRNLVISALKLGEFDWVNNFLDTHPPERICGTRYPAEAHSVNLSEYYFYLKQYDKALDNLVYRLFENPTMSILADVLLVKIYYETKNELLETRMKALDQKVRRAKLSPEMKNRYLNFVRKLDKISKYGWQKNSPKRNRLIAEIKASPEIIAREWLLEKLGA